mmetsp:Transcript_65794/g.130389  ORF Transcript_65794/g.130389 Transcript_65794/m.130389 type:complete len:82 (+) Transcript_65794:165-410(+)
MGNADIRHHGTDLALTAPLVGWQRTKTEMQSRPSAHHLSTSNHAHGNVGHGAYATSYTPSSDHDDSFLCSATYGSPPCLDP